MTENLSIAPLARMALITTLCLSLFANTAAAEGKSDKVEREVFELGLFTGIINVDDFGSEWVTGLSATFQASEDFFLQYNYLETDVDLSSFEESQGRYFRGSDRDFVHYDLLVGYNIFQGEVYPRPGNTKLSSFYVTGGVGETRFGDEENFTFTLGVGYKIAITRDILLQADYRSYIYESSLIQDKERTTQSSQFTVGASYLF